MADEECAHIELLQVTLGLQPFVLIRVARIGNESMMLQVNSGGGFDCQEDEIVLLLNLLKQLTGVSTDALGAEIDLARVAAGKPTLAEAVNGGAT